MPRFTATNRRNLAGLLSLLALAGCSNARAEQEIADRIARAEAAAVRAETAQHAAEAAATRALTDKLAVNNAAEEDEAKERSDAANKEDAEIDARNEEANEPQPAT